MSALKDQFLLDPDVVFLNHGSFGATPRPVFDAYQKWQRELERQPVRFMTRHLADRLAEAQQVLVEACLDGVEAKGVHQDAQQE